MSLANYQILKELAAKMDLKNPQKQCNYTARTLIQLLSEYYQSKQIEGDPSNFNIQAAKFPRAIKLIFTHQSHDLVLVKINKDNLYIVFHSFIHGFSSLQWLNTDQIAIANQTVQEMDQEGMNNWIPKIYLKIYFQKAANKLKGDTQIKIRDLSKFILNQMKLQRISYLL